MKQLIGFRLLLMLLFLISFSFIGFSQQTPMNPIKYFSEHSKSVKEHSYYVTSNTASVISYFNSLGLTRYSKSNYDMNTIRFRNNAKNVFVMVFRISSNKTYIVMSREEYVDEVDV